MSAPLIIGGIEIAPHAGQLQVSYGSAGGATDVVLSSGKPVRMRHWDKWQVSITGSGWMLAGLDALDWDAEHLLLLPRPRRVNTQGGPITLLRDPRPDAPVACHALVGKQWIATPTVVTGREVSFTPVPGASQYSVGWYPQITALCTPPPEDYDSGSVDWQIIAREV